MKGSHAPESADLAVRKAGISQGRGEACQGFTKVEVKRAWYAEDGSVLR